MNLQTNINLTSNELGQVTMVVRGFPQQVVVEGRRLILINSDGQRFEVAEKQGVWWMAAGGALYSVMDRVLQEMRREFSQSNLLTAAETERDQLVAKILLEVLKIRGPRY